MSDNTNRRDENCLVCGNPMHANGTCECNSAILKQRIAELEDELMHTKAALRGILRQTLAKVREVLGNE